MRPIFLFIFLSLLWTGNTLNLHPIIGILSQEPSSSILDGQNKNYTSYIAASYVKFIESAGGRVAPIWINKDEAYYKRIAASVNGILFPGGSAPIYNTSGYGMAGQILYKEILERNAKGDYLPLWATCLGFEMLMYLSASFVDLKVGCAAENIALPLIPMKGYSNSKLFSQMPSDVFNILTSENVTANFHKFCYTKEDIILHGLDKDYYLVTKNYDVNNFEFLSTIEHRTLPIFGTQWHPEKNAYEWKFDSIPHTMDAIYSVQYLADFFVSEARLNDQKFENEEEEQNSLIYGYEPTYEGNTSSSFVQVYLFQE